MLYNKIICFLKERKRMTNKIFFTKVLNKQVGGSHYQDFVIQPADFVNKNKMLFAEGNAIKYICRHSKKNKAEDIKKAIHYLEMILERDYKEEVN
jgi:hypothetical protein